MKNEKSKFCKTKNQKVKNQKPKNCETKNRRARPSYFAISDQSHNCPVSCRTCCCQGVSHALLVFVEKTSRLGSRINVRSVVVLPLQSEWRRTICNLFVGRHGRWQQAFGIWGDGGGGNYCVDYLHDGRF